MGSTAGYLAWVRSVPKEPAAKIAVGCAGGRLCVCPQKGVAQKAFIRPGIDMGDAIVRDSSDRRFACGRAFCLLRTSENSGPCSCNHTISRRTKETP
jgi:hypothetical protein